MQKVYIRWGLVLPPPFTFYILQGRKKMSFQNACFTLNNPTVLEIENLHRGVEELNANYIVFQLEKGEQGTEHIQGYIKMRKRFTLAGIKVNIGERCHVERARGSAKQNRKYCMKDEGRVEGPWEYGSLPEQGKRNDLREFLEVMKEKTLKDSEIIDEYPEIYAKYPRFVNVIRDHVRENKLCVERFVPRSGWQEDLADSLRSEPNPRTIKWFYDETGNSGKSYFGRSYARGAGDKTCFYASSGKHADILYAYSSSGCPEIVFFDWARSEEEKFPYGLLEKLKNGIFLNTKYESRQIIFNIPHVVVFANFQPDLRQWSKDRVELVIISQNNFSIFNQ